MNMSVQLGIPILYMCSAPQFFPDRGKLLDERLLKIPDTVNQQLARYWVSGHQMQSFTGRSVRDPSWRPFHDCSQAVLTLHNQVFQQPPSYVSTSWNDVFCLTLRCRQVQETPVDEVKSRGRWGCVWGQRMTSELMTVDPVRVGGSSS